MKYCDGFIPPDREPDMFNLLHLRVDPIPPVIGHRISMHAGGVFSEEIARAPNLTVLLFLEMDRGSYVTYGDTPFCEATSSRQTVGGVNQEVCPPVEGYADFHTDTYIPRGLPSVSQFSLGLL